MSVHLLLFVVQALACSSECRLKPAPQLTLPQPLPPVTSLLVGWARPPLRRSGSAGHLVPKTATAFLFPATFPQNVPPFPSRHPLPQTRLHRIRRPRRPHRPHGK